MKKREILIISITIFLTVIAWLTADIVHASKKQDLEGRVNFPNIKNYQLDEKILEILESKIE